jgi:SAM-dependent methyltransferase
MRETTKAMARRWREADAGEFPWRDIFKGQVLDVGSGDDGLKADACVTYFDLPDGGGDDLTKFFPSAVGFYDTVHASNVLEHMLDPVVALRSWLEVLKPGGYIVATVPDWELYEGKVWPSRWNSGHRSTWSMMPPPKNAESRTHISLPFWLSQFPVEIIRCKDIFTNYDFLLGTDIDQTFDFEKGVEAFIEFVLKKQ